MTPDELVGLLRAISQQGDLIAVLRAEVARLQAENQQLHDALRTTGEGET